MLCFLGGKKFTEIHLVAADTERGFHKKNMAE